MSRPCKWTVLTLEPVEWPIAACQPPIELGRDDRCVYSQFDSFTSSWRGFDLLTSSCLVAFGPVSKDQGVVGGRSGPPVLSHLLDA